MPYNIFLCDRLFAVKTHFPVDKRLQLGLEKLRDRVIESEFQIRLRGEEIYFSGTANERD